VIAHVFCDYNVAISHFCCLRALAYTTVDKLRSLFFYIIYDRVSKCLRDGRRSDRTSWHFQRRTFNRRWPSIYDNVRLMAEHMPSERTSWHHVFTQHRHGRRLACVDWFVRIYRVPHLTSPQGKNLKIDYENCFDASVTTVDPSLTTTHKHTHNRTEVDHSFAPVPDQAPWRPTGRRNDFGAPLRIIYGNRASSHGSCWLIWPRSGLTPTRHELDHFPSHARSLSWL